MSNETVDNIGAWSMCPYYDVEAPEERRCKPDNSVCPVNGNANECDEDYITEDLKAAATKQLNDLSAFEAAEDEIWQNKT